MIVPITSNLKRHWRTVLLCAVAIVAPAVAGGVIWAHVAGAGKGQKPSALAETGTLRVAREGAKLALGSERSSIRGTELSIERGWAKGKRATIGGGEEVIAALTGSLTPVAVDSADGGTVVYDAWHQISNPQPGIPGQGVKFGEPIGIPSVRVYSEASGKDMLIERGALSPALSLDGRLAFLRGETDTLRNLVDYAGQIVVGTVDGPSFEPWTSEPAKYYPYAWVGSTLLAYKALPDSETGDLYAFTGPGRARLLAPDAWIVAISPDGSRVLMLAGASGWDAVVEIVRVRDGAIEASVPVRSEGDSFPSPLGLGWGGSWYGGRVVAPAGLGLTVLDVREGIRIESILESPSRLPHGIDDPLLLDDTHLVGWADLAPLPERAATGEPPHDNALVRCDLAAQSCDIGPVSPPRIWTRWVINPSR